MGKLELYLTTTKHDTAQTVHIILLIYTMNVRV